MIIETSDNRFYRVTENTDPALSHVWNGVEVKKARGGFVDKKNARETLVRKAASKVIAA
jgi:hypothetical protein